MTENHESIKLSLPVNSAYIQTARQTAASIAGRMGFAADEAEDIVTAVAETCGFIIKRNALNSSETYDIHFLICHDRMEIRLHCETERFTTVEANGLEARLRGQVDEAYVVCGDKMVEIVLRMGFLG